MKPNRAFTRFTTFLIKLTQTSFFRTSNELKCVQLLVITLEDSIFGFKRSNIIIRPITKNHFFTFQVHPCGRYRHNTVVFILAKEHGLKNLRTIHRLDRLTSGLLLFGRNPKKAREMEQQIRTRQVQKEYVCRVEGEFPA